VTPTIIAQIPRMESLKNATLRIPNTPGGGSAVSEQRNKWTGQENKDRSRVGSASCGYSGALPEGAAGSRASEEEMRGGQKRAGGRRVTPTEPA
jgi:hypothetical protein